MSRTIVVALGGNALQKKGEASAEAQQRVAADTASQLIPLIEAGHKLVIVHGNGPQVGNIVLHEEAINTEDVPTLPLDSCGAMSQGSIGYWLQQAFNNELKKKSIDKPVSTLITQTLVDEKDPAFENPSKPIGPFYETEQEANKAAEERGFVVKEDSGRGWRRVVPSPKPKAIVEKEAIETLINNNVLVITAGGGGVPVVEKNGQLEGVEAVIDKDFSAARLADMIQADQLIILTAVEAAMINYGKPEARSIGRISTFEMQKYVDEGYFAAGSMLPKVLASMQFVADGQGHGLQREAIITSLEKAAEAAEGEVGTIIH